MIQQDGIKSYFKQLPNLLHIYSSTIKRGILLKQLEDPFQVTSNSKKTLPKPTIFISYSHQDKKWLTRLQTHLKVLQNLYGDVNYWDDTQIEIGDSWLKEIENNLNAASIAILLVSTDFLASDFVMQKEVPRLLSQAQKRGVRIMPLILSPCLFTDSPIGQYQAVNAPEEALEELQKTQQEKIYIKLMLEIKKFLPN